MHHIPLMARGKHGAQGGRRECGWLGLAEGLAPLLQTVRVARAACTTSPALHTLTRRVFGAMQAAQQWRVRAVPMWGNLIVWHLAKFLAKLDGTIEPTSPFPPPPRGIASQPY